MRAALFRTSWSLALLAAVAFAGCKGGKKADPMLSLSAAESLAQGKELLAQEKYPRARPFLVHAFEVEPNSATGREALLLAADTFYLEGGSGNYVSAEAKYRDFLNRFPTSERSAYAQFQVASSLAKRMERPDRDQSMTRKALAACEELLRLYPTSEYAAQAREQIRVVRDNLAEHELVVGRFYLRYGIPVAAVQRMEYLLATYPEYGEKDKAFFYLGQAYQEARRGEEANTTFERLERQFPDSPYIKEIPKVRANAPAADKGKKDEKAAPEVDKAPIEGGP